MRIRLKYQRGYIFMSESQFNYLSTLKNAHLSSNSYYFWMQPNIPMKFTGYVAWILLCKHCKFREKIYYNSRDVEFFLGDYFFGAPCISAACIKINIHDIYVNIYKWIKHHCQYRIVFGKFDSSSLSYVQFHLSIFSSYALNWQVSASFRVQSLYRIVTV